LEPRDGGLAYTRDAVKKFIEARHKRIQLYFQEKICSVRVPVSGLMERLDLLRILYN